MKFKSLCVLAGLGGAVLFTASAQAAFDRIVTELKTFGHIDPFDPTREVAVLNLYARFTQPGDQLIIVFGDADDPLQLDTDAPGGYWNPFNGSLPPGQDVIDMFPSAEFDSYLTIGTKRATIPFGPLNGNDVSSPYEHPSQAGLTFGFDPLPSFGAPSQIFTSGGAVVAPATIADAPGPPDNADLPQIKTPQTLAGPDGLVLFAQLSITSGTVGQIDDPDFVGSIISGIINIGVREKDADPPNQFREIRGIEYFFQVPSPGALALLGIAGLAGVRRRRG
ncbi:MAG: hypothetical protein ACYS0G_02280 [Planctomycetota bacterium]|jgi:hypothetical protein